MKPNIFHFATSELSQDAFLFWLLLHANLNDENSKASAIARLFIYEIFDHEISKSILKPKDLKNYNIIPYRQFLNIDILLLFESQQENNRFLILIEDKVHSGESRESQVEYYLNNLSNIEKFKSIPVLPVYFKTGYTSIQEIELISHSNIIYYGIEKISHLLKRVDQSLEEDLILSSWISFFKENFEPILDAKSCEIDESETLKSIYQGKFRQISDELYFTRITELLFENLQPDFFTECFPVQGIGHVDWHFSITKPKWSNKELNFSFGIYFVWGGEYSLKLKTSTYEYKPIKQLSEIEKKNYSENQSHLKIKIQGALNAEWQMTNFPLQIAKLSISEEESLVNLKLRLHQNIKEISRIIDSMLH